MTGANATVVRLGDVAEVRAGFGFPEYLQGRATGLYPFYKVGDISEAWKAKQVGLVAANHYVDDADLPTLKARPLPAGAIVFAKIGAAIGLNRRCVLTKPSLIDNNVFGLVPKPGVANTKYLFQFMCSIDLMPLARATTVPSLRKGDVEELLLPLPSLARQQQVAAYLDEQLSRLDASVAALHRVQANLKRYRASVLKSACEGRLVPTEAELARQEGRTFETGAQLLQRILAERRARPVGRGKYKEPSAPEANRLCDSPEGWVWSNVDQLAEVGTGATPKRDTPAFYEGGHIAWVTSGVVNGEYVDRASEFVTERALTETNLTIYPPGTLLLAMYGEGKTRGRCSELRIAATTNQALAAIQATEPVRRYLRLLLERSYEETRKAASGGVQPNLNLSLVRAIAVPLPPLAEQHRIVAEADRRLSLIRVAEAQVTANLARAQRLRQSILQAAFSRPVQTA